MTPTLDMTHNWVCLGRMAGKARPTAVLLALLTVSVVGCARPMGTLFEPIDPPRVWPPPPDEPRIKLLGALSDSRDIKAARSGREAFLSVLRGPRPPIRFLGPHAVACGTGSEPVYLAVENRRRTDLLAVADAAAGAVHIIDLEQRTHVLVSGWRPAGAPDATERFGVPIGVAWAGNALFVTDAQRGEVIELDAQGRYRRRFGGEALDRPVGIAYVARRKQLYVVDGNAHRLTVFDLAGNVVRTIGGPGVKPGSFNYPTHLCVRRGGAPDMLAVADSGNFRVQLLDLDGRPLRTIGQKGDGAGDFALPKGVAFDSDGNIYVVDAQFENVQVFNTQGRLLMAFGAEGREPGRFWLPAGLAIDADDRIWVADSGNRRVQVFEYMGAAS